VRLFEVKKLNTWTIRGAREIIKTSYKLIGRPKILSVCIIKPHKQNTAELRNNNSSSS
jgi:hypothetical protein